MLDIIRGLQVLKRQNYIRQNNLLAHSPKFCPSNFTRYTVSLFQIDSVEVENMQCMLMPELLCEVVITQTVLI